MFEFHGWATVRFTAENRDRDDEDALQEAAVQKVWSYIRELGYGPVHAQAQAPTHPRDPRSRFSGRVVSAAKANVVLDLRRVNGEAQVWAAGFKNHATPVKRELLDMFHYFAQVAPGSYGLLYTRDDEDPDHDNEFRVYVLARGTLTEHADPFLSPIMPTVEDP
jgi:hypothetical protein